MDDGDLGENSPARPNRSVANNLFESLGPNAAMFTAGPDNAGHFTVTWRPAATVGSSYASKRFSATYQYVSASSRESTILVCR